MQSLSLDRSNIPVLPIHERLISETQTVITGLEARRTTLTAGDIIHLHHLKQLLDLISWLMLQYETQERRYAGMVPGSIRATSTLMDLPAAGV